MVQLKYFGDSRDYFKYDLITYLMKQNEIPHYIFIPMLTNHRFDNEGNKLPKYIDGKSKELLSFIDNCDSRDLNHWETWLKPNVSSYKTIKPVNEIYFCDKDNLRPEYWNKFSNIMNEPNTLIFVDPDTGLETGKPSYIKRMGREKYILNAELKLLFDSIDNSSILMIYQHLPMNKKIHEDSVNKKITQVISVTKNQYVLAYREDDLAFLFIMKDEKKYNIINILLKDYYENSGHKYKSFHPNI